MAATGNFGLDRLPPSPDERTAFLQDVTAHGEAAYSRVVDRLLDSPQYGERWASVWLDQVRYADSKGVGADARRNIWKYRDWVINAFNLIYLSTNSRQNKLPATCCLTERSKTGSPPPPTA